MSRVDPRLVAALRAQAARRPAGARRVGWKVGAGERERIGGELAVGYLTSASVLEPGATYPAGGGDLHADAEVALELGDGETIARYGVALELVDLAGDDEPEAVVAGNVFHRAVAFGPLGPSPPAGAHAALVVNGERRASAPVPVDLAARVRAVARALRAIGERLRAGDRIITGSVVQVRVAAGDLVVAELGGLGRVPLAIA